MAWLNKLGGLLGSGTLAPRAWAQQNALNVAFAAGDTYITSGAIALDPKNAYKFYGDSGATPNAEAETALEWLDRRVEEMRVAL